MVLLCRNNAAINAHVKTQNRVKQQVWHTDPTRPGQNRWPGDSVTWRPGFISGATANVLLTYK